MELNEFLELAKPIYRPWEGRNNFSCADKTPELHYLWMSHCSGGMKGGSCYGTYPEAYVNTDPMPEFNSLYEFYELILPNITFLQAKKIDSLFVKTTEYCGYCDYYGNSSDYIIKYVYLDDLYVYLCENNLI